MLYFFHFHLQGDLEQRAACCYKPQHSTASYEAKAISLWYMDIGH
jgi:hypothetical protein